MQIDTLSRINHKNFVNLLGYCEEEEPFTRMMVFEYAPNGTLCEHLHGNFSETTMECKSCSSIWGSTLYGSNINVTLCWSVKEVEHLDWGARMRIIMGTAYCLQYMHHDLNPPVAHTNLTSSAIYLTDDYAAKVHIINSHLVTFTTILNSLSYHQLPFAFADCRDHFLFKWGIKI